MTINGFRVDVPELERRLAKQAVRKQEHLARLNEILPLPVTTKDGKPAKSQLSLADANGLVAQYLLDHGVPGRRCRTPTRTPFRWPATACWRWRPPTRRWPSLVSAGGFEVSHQGVRARPTPRSPAHPIRRRQLGRRTGRNGSEPGLPATASGTSRRFRRRRTSRSRG